MPFTRPSLDFEASRVGAANVSSKHQAITGKSMGWGWWTGETGGWTAGLRQDAQMMSFATKCVRLWLVRRRVAIIIADNLKMPTAKGSLPVRSMLTELSDQLSLVSMPAYDPDANRIEWLWHSSRRIVTHNHHRETFEALSRTPGNLLRHIGSPFAPDKRPDRPQVDAA